PALGYRQYVENEHFEFQSIFPVQLDALGGFIEVRHLLAGDVIGKPARILCELGQEIEVEDMNGRAAGPDAQLAIVIRLTAQTLRQIGVLDDATTAIDQDDVAQFILRPLFANNFAGDFRVGGQVVAQKNGVGNVHEGIVHLEIENSLNVLPTQ